MSPAIRYGGRRVRAVRHRPHAFRKMANIVASRPPRPRGWQPPVAWRRRRLDLRSRAKALICSARRQAVVDIAQPVPESDLGGIVGDDMMQEHLQNVPVFRQSQQPNPDGWFPGQRKGLRQALPEEGFPWRWIFGETRRTGFEQPDDYAVFGENRLGEAALPFEEDRALGGLRGGKPSQRALERWQVELPPQEEGHRQEEWMPAGDSLLQVPEEALCCRSGVRPGPLHVLNRFGQPVSTGRFPVRVRIASGQSERL